MIEIEKSHPNSEKLVLALVPSTHYCDPHQSAFKASATQVWLFKLSELDIVYRPSFSIKRQSITDFSTEFTDNLEEDWMEIDGSTFNHTVKYEGSTCY